MTQEHNTGEGVRIKPLVWPSEIKRGQRVMSGYGLIQYTICHYGGTDPSGGTVYRWAAQNEGWHGPLFSYEDAIVAVQADYERRVLSSLEASPAGAARMARNGSPCCKDIRESGRREGDEPCNQCLEASPAPVSEDEIENLIEELLDAQQDINLAANERMDQSLCDASALIDRTEALLRRVALAAKGGQ